MMKRYSINFRWSFKLLIVSILLTGNTLQPVYAQQLGKKEKNKKLFNKKKEKVKITKKYKCPDKPEKKTVVEGNIKDPEEEVEVDLASIRRFEKKIFFDIVFIKQAELEIPAFKQFKNNMTDFTRHGEEQFKEIIQKIREYLGENTSGKGITLRIIGSASQIPTSYDPSKPNNNINADGSSKIGQTSIENNRKLAQARALELAKKIQLVFPEIGIATPSLEEITLGGTPWDSKTQKALNDAVIRADEEAKKAVFEPFQKEQFVKVESQGQYEKKIKPKTIEMHLVSTRPRITYNENGKEKEIIRFITSSALYDRIGENKTFPTAEERDAYLKAEGFEIYQHPKTKKWYMYQSKAELEAIKIVDNYKRIYEMYEVGIVEEKERDTLKEIITEKYLGGVKDIVIEY